MDCDFVLICGDLVHHASDSSFAEFLNIAGQFSKPYYLVAGNHDVGNVPSDSTLGYFRENLGKDYYAFRYKGFGFLVVNTQLWKTDIGEESKLHEKWFIENLDRLNRKHRPVIIAGHHPLYVQNPEEEEQYFNLPAGKRDMLLDLFVDNGVVAYLSGHKHETLINLYKEIQFVTGESTSKNFDKRPLGFRQWEISRDTILHNFIPLESGGGL
jgi:3',5'-cyclic AMP phosphodiesterase CpdA